MSDKADQIVKALGGTAKVASALNLPVTTVHGWQRVNFVPDWRRDALLSLALDRGVALSTADFPTEAERVSRRTQAA